MSEKTDTPRTDKAAFDRECCGGEYLGRHVYNADGDYVEADFARQLERERDRAVELLTEARLQLEYLHDKFLPTSTGAAVISRISGFLSSLKG